MYCYRLNYLFRGQRNRIADRAFVLHVANLTSISGISYGPPSLIVVISEGRVKSNPRAWLCVCLPTHTKKEFFFQDSCVFCGTLCLLWNSGSVPIFSSELNWSESVLPTTLLPFNPAKLYNYLANQMLLKLQVFSFILK